VIRVKVADSVDLYEVFNVDADNIAYDAEALELIKDGETVAVFKSWLYALLLPESENEVPFVVLNDFDDEGDLEDDDDDDLDDEDEDEDEDDEIEDAEVIETNDVERTITDQAEWARLQGLLRSDAA